MKWRLPSQKCGAKERVKSKSKVSEGWRKNASERQGTRRKKGKKQRTITRGHAQLLNNLVLALNRYYDGWIPDEVLSATNDLSTVLYEYGPSATKTRLQKERLKATLQKLMMTSTEKQ